MKVLSFFLLVLLIATTDVGAESSVYVCIQPNGNREYRNTGDTRGCKKLDLESISMIPAPPSARTGSRATSDPSFPRIDNFVQNQCDQDRLQILQEEVWTEESKLSELKKEY